jgi:high-affinity Fe2+/Pb2+ permease
MFASLTIADCVLPSVAALLAVVAVWWFLTVSESQRAKRQQTIKSQPSPRSGLRSGL